MSTQKQVPNPQPGTPVPDDGDIDLRKLYREVLDARESEVIQTLSRYTDLKEFVALFGQGDSFEERVATGLQRFEPWLMLQGCTVPPGEIEKLRKSVGDRTLEYPIEDLGGSLGLAAHWLRPVLIEPTDRGFAVNGAASGYGNHVLLEVRLSSDTDVRVRDMPGDAKFVPFEPSYVSTPPIFIYDCTTSAYPPPGVAAHIQLHGRLLDRESHAALRDLVSEPREPEALAEALNGLTRDGKIFGIERTYVLRFVEAEMRFPTEDARSDYFDRVHAVLFPDG